MHRIYKAVVLFGLMGIFLIAASGVLSAQRKPQSKQPVNTEIKAPGQVKADSILSGNIPVIYFPEKEFDFGNVQQESDISHIFKVRNTGSAPLKIINAKAS